MKNKTKLFLMVLGPLCIASFLFTLVPSLRKNVLKLNKAPERKILSTIQLDYFSDGRQIQFAKISEDGKIKVEVYHVQDEQGLVLLNTIILPDAKDGYFHFRGQATNFVLEDIDRDGLQEVLAPTFDGEQTPHLNVYRYNKESSDFEPMAAPDSFN